MQCRKLRLITIPLEVTQLCAVLFENNFATHALNLIKKFLVVGVRIDLNGCVVIVDASNNSVTGWDISHGVPCVRGGKTVDCNLTPEQSGGNRRVTKETFPAEHESCTLAAGILVEQYWDEVKLMLRESVNAEKRSLATNLFSESLSWFRHLLTSSALTKDLGDNGTFDLQESLRNIRVSKTYVPGDVISLLTKKKKKIIDYKQLFFWNKRP